jgi:hypothetical protein
MRSPVYFENIQQVDAISDYYGSIRARSDVFFRWCGRVALVGGRPWFAGLSLRDTGSRRAARVCAALRPLGLCLAALDEDGPFLDGGVRDSLDFRRMRRSGELLALIVVE